MTVKGVYVGNFDPLKLTDFLNHVIHFYRLISVKIKNYIVRNPTHCGTQAIPVMSEHDVNTDRFETTTKGVYHIEGGWSKDINPSGELTKL